MSRTYADTRPLQESYVLAVMCHLNAKTDSAKAFWWSVLRRHERDMLNAGLSEKNITSLYELAQESEEHHE